MASLLGCTAHEGKSTRNIILDSERLDNVVDTCEYTFDAAESDKEDREDQGDVVPLVKKAGAKELQGTSEHVGNMLASEGHLQIVIRRRLLTK